MNIKLNKNKYDNIRIKETIYILPFIAALGVLPSEVEAGGFFSRMKTCLGCSSDFDKEEENLGIERSFYSQTPSLTPKPVKVTPKCQSLVSVSAEFARRATEENKNFEDKNKKITEAVNASLDLSIELIVPQKAQPSASKLVRLFSTYDKIYLLYKNKV